MFTLCVAVSHSQITRLYSRFHSLDKGENGALRYYAHTVNTQPELCNTVPTFDLTEEPEIAEESVSAACSGLSL